MKLFKVAKRYGAQVAVGVGVGVASASSMAQVANPADAAAALATLSGTTTAYGPPLFGLAVVATGIMIGLAWIKKARGAAR